jgi:5'-nucleotidase / UDP-sugar diphosphatase
MLRAKKHTKKFSPIALFDKKFPFYFSSILLLICLSRLASAQLLQIIHTNDLHSFFEHGNDAERGGYAALKYQIDQLKSEATAQGIDSLTLDAGDFSEGTPFFIANKGLDSWAMMDSLGYDAVTLGNHDWLVGLDLMNDLLGRLQPRVPFLSANFHFNRWYENIARAVFPSAEFHRSGVKISVLGLSTEDALYRWRIRDGTIESPKFTARNFIPQLKRNNDFIIALTHLGVSEDLKLIRNTSGIDLVVGGHSHTHLFQALYEKNLDKKTVPVVQAGEHGEFIGDLLVDLEKGKPLQILRYRLIPVLKNSPKDTTVSTLVSQSRARLEKLFGEQTLYDPLAVSSVPLERPLTRSSWWGTFFVETLLEVTDADLALDVGEFFGATQPAGPVSLETLISFYPRIFNFNLPFGWTIWTLSVPGYFLKEIIDSNSSSISGSNQNLVTVGVTQDEETGVIWIQGKKLKNEKRYKVAVTEGIGRGALESARLYHYFLNPKDSGISLLNAIAQKIKRLGPIIGPVPYPILDSTINTSSKN